MPKQQITIEVDIPDGYEATGEFRCPNVGEYWIYDHCLPACGLGFVLPHSPRLILRKTWQWPEWLKAPWIAMDKNGEWYAYKEQPDLMDCFVTWQSSGPSSLVLIDCLLFDFTPPECTDWKQSLRKNPNAK